MVRNFCYFLAMVLMLNVTFCLDSYGQHNLQGKPATTTVEKELRMLYERLLLASKNRDEKTLREILTEDYSQVTADGKVRTKASRIKETLSSEDKTDILALESFQLHVYQNAAVATCLVRDKGAIRGESYDNKMLSTATFIKTGKGWQIAATHLTFVKE